VEEHHGQGIEDKLKKLRDRRRVCGLCIPCGEKWSHDHKCSETVQLHVLQEFWDICHSDASEDSKHVAESLQTQVFLGVLVVTLSEKSFVSAI
jgi:hypothetical protein